MALNSRVCAGMKGEKKKNAAIPHSVNAETKVLASISWVHDNQDLAVCGPVSLAGKRMRAHTLKAWQVRMPNR